MPQSKRGTTVTRYEHYRPSRRVGLRSRLSKNRGSGSPPNKGRPAAETAGLRFGLVTSGKGTSGDVDGVLVDDLADLEEQFVGILVLVDFLAGFELFGSLIGVQDAQN